MSPCPAPLQPRTRRVLRFLLPALLLPCIPGCMGAILLNDAHHMTLERATTPHVSKRFRVLDAETAQPVSGARVAAVHNFDWMSDWFNDATTDASGIATLRLAEGYPYTVAVCTERHLDRFDVSPGASPGTGSPDENPIDILVYRKPDSGVGWRFAEGFRGSVVVGSTGRTDFGKTVLVGARKQPAPAFQVPAAFPPGQRIWWTDIVPGRVNEITPPPSLGDRGRNSYPAAQAISVGERRIPISEPGAYVEGLAAWHIGTYFPDGPWGGTYSVVVIGTREGALSKAKSMYAEHGNGDEGYIFDGWLRYVAPHIPRRGTSTYSVTRR